MKTHNALALVGSFALVTGLVYAQERSPAQRMADLIVDKGCSIVIDKDRELWRDANASDYAGSEWAGWRQYTGSKTPWLATGDFDADGVQDVAKIIVRKSDGVWMLGVEFGQKPGEACKRTQISTNSQNKAVPIGAVLNLPLKAARIVCGHWEAASGVECAPKPDSPLAARKADALIHTDAYSGVLTGYLWQQWKQSKKRDGSPLMVFQDYAVDTVYDKDALTKGATKAQAEAKPGDSVSPAERTALIAQFEAAYKKADQRAHRITTRSETTIGSVVQVMSSTADFSPPDKYYEVTQHTGAPVSETLRIGQKGWTRQGSGAWAPAAPDALPDPSSGLYLGNAAITAVKSELVNGRKVKTLYTVDRSSGSEYVMSVSIDEATQLPVKRVSSLSDPKMVTTMTHDFERKISIPTP